ncbi:glycosyl transferase [Bacteroidia bacterium]|nr:glycosyl transferase [Bacteroidia bacterium]
MSVIFLPLDEIDMKVLYDNQIFSTQNFGGISRYFCELIKNLDKEIDYDLPIALSNNFYLTNPPITAYRTFFPRSKFVGQTSVIKFFNNRLQRKHFKRDYDLFHPTYYDPYFLNLVEGKPFVLTIHDLTHEKYALKTKRDDWSVAGKKILAEKAAHIIAVSENTKKDIVELLHIHPDKIKTIYHGCSLNPNHRQAKMHLPDRFLLFVGERRAYKNFERLAEAFSLILPSDNELHLICAGKPFSAEEQKVLHSLKIDQNIHCFAANNEELATLYSSALAFVFPSLYEGFGIPILEAFACGCPLILSDASCFPEIAGDAGAYFNPLDVDAMVETIKKVIYDPSCRANLIRTGTARGKLFSWEKCAAETVHLYQSIT